MNGLYQEVKHRKSFSVLTLHRQTKKQAMKERKIPISVLHEEGMHGLVYLIHSSDLDDAIITLAVNRGVRIFADRCPQCGKEAFTEDRHPHAGHEYLVRRCSSCRTVIPYARRSIDEGPQSSLFPRDNRLPLH